MCLQFFIKGIMQYVLIYIYVPKRKGLEGNAGLLHFGLLPLPSPPLTIHTLGSLD